MEIALDFIYGYGLFSIEKSGTGKPSTRATKSELRRWFAKRCIEINGRIAAWSDELTFPLQSVVIFPGNPAKRNTLWRKEVL